jgi:hypothetical protein
MEFYQRPGPPVPLVSDDDGGMDVDVADDRPKKAAKAEEDLDPMLDLFFNKLPLNGSF